MVIWSGLGLLLPVIVFAGLMLMQGSVDLVAGDGIYSAHQWIQGMSLALSGLVSWIWASWRDRRWFLMLNEATHEGVEWRASRDSLFFVPTVYWSLLTVASGLGVVVWGLTR